MSDTPGVIPQSAALAEADPFSLSELMSRDPEGYNRQDRDRIIAALRQDRVRREAAEKAAGEGKRAPRATKVAETTLVPVNIGDIGL